MVVCHLFPISSNHLKENNWECQCSDKANTMHTLEIMQSESDSITLIFQRLGIFYHSITSYSSPFLTCIMFKTFNQSYRQDRVYIGVRWNSLAVQNAQLMIQVTQCHVNVRVSCSTSWVAVWLLSVEKTLNTGHTRAEWDHREWPAARSHATYNNLVYPLRRTGNPRCQSMSTVIKGAVHW